MLYCSTMATFSKASQSVTIPTMSVQRPPTLRLPVINYMGYDAETVGNHDIETGHAVYDNGPAK